jgi:type II secretory pathway pseudopilin PulG
LLLSIFIEALIAIGIIGLLGSIGFAWRLLTRSKRRRRRRIQARMAGYFSSKPVQRRK